MPKKNTSGALPVPIPAYVSGSTAPHNIAYLDTSDTLSVCDFGGTFEAGQISLSNMDVPFYVHLVLGHHVTEFHVSQGSKARRIKSPSTPR
jgi:hypothetical protein